MASVNAANVKLEIDDTVPLTINFLATENTNGHVVYIIKVQRGYDQKYSWQISKRYNEFNELHAQLKLTNFELPLPPKKTFGNMKPEFLVTRQLGLQEFMEKILSNLLLANSLPVKKFLDEENYSQNFRELALAHVSMCFRSEPCWEIVEPLNGIGWRFRKQHVLLKNSDSPNSKFILTWCEHGLDKLLKENELKSIFNQFTMIQHENIEPILRLDSGETSTIMIQKFNEKLISLKDYIYGVTKVTSHYMKKYSQQKSLPTINLSLIKVLSKKILISLQFIYSKGLFYGHLHSGNILIEQNGNSVKLTDLPNGLLGLPYFYRSYLIDQRKIQNIELVDVYGFGHVLYEMTYGEPLLNASFKKDFSDCRFPEIKSVLDILLSEEALKNGLPTINELLEMPFFKNINVDHLLTSSVSAAASSSNTTKLFTSTKTKELLAKAREFIEKRMNDEQKALNKLKRQSQAESKILSEEEIRKRRKEKKKAAQFMNNSLEYPTSQGNTGEASFKSSQTIENKAPQTPVHSLSPVGNVPSFAQSTLPPPPPPPPPSMPSMSKSPNPDRSGLLSSISGFSKQGLKKTVTNDRSIVKL